MKRFLEWIGLKEKLHERSYHSTLFNEGEVWWCYMGENIGTELNGKNATFDRPILIFRKYDKYSFLGLPFSTKIKGGSWYVQIQFLGIKQTVVLVQGRTFDVRRLDKKMGELNEFQMAAVRFAYKDLHLD